jgi:hypothetical protein
VVELQPPHLTGVGEVLELQITAGPLPQGARLVVLTEEGRVLGSVFPSGPSTGLTHTLPVPAEAMTDSVCASGWR